MHNTYELGKNKEPRTPNPDHNERAQSIQPINGSQTKEQENRTNTSEYLLAKPSRLGGNKVKGKRKGRDKGAHRIKVIDVNTQKIGEHLLAEDMGEHLFAETKNWNNRKVEEERRWGYKGMRVGEAHTRQLLRKWSHPYKHACAQRMTTCRNRCTRSQKIKVNIITMVKEITLHQREQ